MKHRLSLLGYEFSKIELETLYVRFIELADEKKLLHDGDLIELVKEKMGKTLFDKVWEEHVVDSIPNGPSILYIDKHLIHEVTSPQAFDGINSRKINVFRPDRTIATMTITFQLKISICQLKIIKKTGRKAYC